MSAEDKIENKAENLGGKVTDDKGLKSEGKADQASSKIKDAFETAKDKVEELGEDAKAGFNKLKDEITGDDK